MPSRHKQLTAERASPVSHLWAVPEPCTLVIAEGLQVGIKVRKGAQPKLPVLAPA